MAKNQNNNDVVDAQEKLLVALTYLTGSLATDIAAGDDQQDLLLSVYPETYVMDGSFMLCNLLVQELAAMHGQALDETLMMLRTRLLALTNP